MSYRHHDAPSRLPSFGSGEEWVHVKVTMLFVVFDVRALVHGPLHEKPGVGVQQIPRAAEHDEPSYAPGIAEEGVEDWILSMLTDPELSEKQLSLLDQPRIHRLDLIDLRVRHPHVQRRRDQEGEVDRMAALCQQQAGGQRDGASCGVAHERCRSVRSEEHTSELQSRGHLVCRLLLEKR